MVKLMEAHEEQQRQAEQRRSVGATACSSTMERSPRHATTRSSISSAWVWRLLPSRAAVVEALAAGELPTLSAALKDLASYPVTYVYYAIHTGCRPRRGPALAASSLGVPALDHGSAHRALQPPALQRAPDEELRRGGATATRPRSVAGLVVSRSATTLCHRAGDDALLR